MRPRVRSTHLDLIAALGALVLLGACASPQTQRRAAREAPTNIGVIPLTERAQAPAPAPDAEDCPGVEHRGCCAADTPSCVMCRERLVAVADFCEARGDHGIAAADEAAGAAEETAAADETQDEAQVSEEDAAPAPAPAPIESAEGQ